MSGLVVSCHRWRLWECTRIVRILNHVKHARWVIYRLHRRRGAITLYHVGKGVPINTVVVAPYAECDNDHKNQTTNNSTDDRADVWVEDT